METEQQHGASARDALATRQELFRYADLNHPLIALLFTEGALQHILPDETEATCN